MVRDPARPPPAILAHETRRNNLLRGSFYPPDRGRGAVEGGGINVDREYTMIPFCDSKDAGRMGVGGGGRERVRHVTRALNSAV